MKRTEPQTIGELLDQLFKSPNIAAKIAEGALPDTWRKVVGPMVAEQTGKTPILLLDDVFDKLDESRVAELISLVSGNTFGQIVITDCSHERMERLLESSGAEYKLFDVTYGKVLE